MNSREFKKTRVFRRSPFGKLTKIIMCSFVFRCFLVLFFHFPCQQTCVNSRKRLFSNVYRTMNFRKISCLPHVFTGIFLYFLGQWVRVNSRKCLFPSIHRSVNGWKIARISTFSSHFLGRYIRVFFSFYRLALFAPSHPLYRTTSWLPILRGIKLIPFPSQKSKHKWHC